jgi:hypothetical protein
MKQEEMKVLKGKVIVVRALDKEGVLSIGFYKFPEEQEKANKEFDRLFAQDGTEAWISDLASVTELLFPKEDDSEEETDKTK